MISRANLESSGLDKDELTDMVRSMESNSDQNEIAKCKKIESKSNLNIQAKFAKSKKGQSKSNRKVQQLGNENQSSNLSIPTLESSSLHDKKTGCCCCPRKKQTKKKETSISQFAKKHCHNPNELFDLLKKTTESIRGSLGKLKTLKKLLLYEDDPDAVEQGLSRIGGNMWILTFAIQHLIDPENTIDDLPQELLKIRVIYQEIGASSQEFLLMGERFYTKIDEMRDTGISVVKNLQKILKGQGLENPFIRRPEVFYRKNEVKRRLRVGVPQDFNDCKSRQERVDMDEIGTFQVHWTPLNIAYRDDREESWKNFAFLDIRQKLSIFKEFANSCLEFLETLIQKFASETTAVLSMTATDFTSDEEITTTLVEVAKGILNFLVEGGWKGDPEPRGQRQSRAYLSKIESWSSILVEYWMQVDFLYEVTYDLTLLIEESRDAVRICYVYTINFYHWKLTNFDDFDPVTKTQAYKKNMKKVHNFITKLLRHRRYSDAALFLSLAEFTSSVYQEIAKRHEVEAHGMRMKLEPHIFDEPSETWGLDSEYSNEIRDETVLNAIC